MTQPKHIIKYLQLIRVMHQILVKEFIQLSKLSGYDFVDLCFYFRSVVSESMKPPYFHSSVSVPYDPLETELSICGASASFSEQKK
jgi:hypothetical protein